MFVDERLMSLSTVKTFVKYTRIFVSVRYVTWVWQLRVGMYNPQPQAQVSSVGTAGTCTASNSISKNSLNTVMEEAGEHKRRLFYLRNNLF